MQLGGPKGSSVVVVHNVGLTSPARQTQTETKSDAYEHRWASNFPGEAYFRRDCMLTLTYKKTGRARRAYFPDITISVSKS